MSPVVARVLSKTVDIYIAEDVELNARKRNVVADEGHQLASDPFVFTE